MTDRIVFSRNTAVAPAVNPSAKHDAWGYGLAPRCQTLVEKQKKARWVGTRGTKRGETLQSHDFFVPERSWKYGNWMERYFQMYGNWSEFDFHHFPLNWKPFYSDVVCFNTSFESSSSRTIFLVGVLSRVGEVTQVWPHLCRESPDCAWSRGKSLWNVWWNVNSLPGNLGFGNGSHCMMDTIEIDWAFSCIFGTCAFGKFFRLWDTAHCASTGQLHATGDWYFDYMILLKR